MPANRQTTEDESGYTSARCGFEALPAGQTRTARRIADRSAPRKAACAVGRREGKRKKKPPERPCPRGAKDTDSSGSDWILGVAAAGIALTAAGRSCVSKRPARFHAGGGSLRGPQEGRRRGLPGCGPTHVDRLLVDSRFAPASIHIRADASAIR